MRILDNIRLSIKLPLVMAFLAWVAISLTAVLGWLDMRQQSVEQANDALELAAHGRAMEVAAFFDELAIDVKMQAGLPTTGKAVVGLGLAFRFIDEADPAGRVRRLYIDGNPYAAFDRARLLDAEDGSQYSRNHATYHEHFVQFVRLNGLTDALLIDPEGNVVYTVRKAADLGMNVLKDGRAARLGEVFGRAMAATPGEVVLSDFGPFEPTGPQPVAFAAATIIGPQDNILGVFVSQVPLEPINRIMKSDLGLPRRTETYLVGPDRRLRSDSRVTPTARALVTPVAGPSSAAALQGGVGVIEQHTFAGDPSLAAYRPVTIGTASWAVVAEEPVDVLHAASWRYLRNVAIKTTGLLVLICIAGWMFSRGISGPLRRVRATMGQVRDGQLDADVPDTGRRDEVGDIARSLEEFRLALLTAREVAQDNQAKSAALAGSSAPMMMVGRDLRIGFVNDALMRILHAHRQVLGATFADFDPDTLVGQPMERFHPDPERVRDLLDDPGNLPHTADLRVGDLRFALHISAIRDSEDRYIGNVVEWQDVTDIRLQHAVLAAIDSHFVTAQIAPDGRILTLNGNFAAALGETEAALVGRNGGDVISFDRSDGMSAETALEILGGGEPVSGAFGLIPRNGESRWVEGGFTPVLDRGGVPIRHLFMGTDTTEAVQEIGRAEEVRSRMEAAQARVVEALKIGLDALAEGDLTTTIDTAFASEYERLRHDFNASVGRLREAMSHVVLNAASIRGEADEINAAATDLSGRTERQAATLEETAAALDELTTSVQGAANGAALADKVVEQARTDAESSGGVVRQAVAAMAEIAAASDKISRIVGVIDDIAFQTNLLALNAGVEAARAGEAGRGFAVVASEVRALSRRSSEAAREIADLITSSGDTVARGVDLVGRTGTALERIVESVKGVAGHVSEIAVSAREQSTGLLEINTAINRLDRATQQNAAMFAQTNATSNALAHEAEALTVMTSAFRTGVEMPGRNAAPSAAPVSIATGGQDPAEAAITPEHCATAIAARADHDQDWEDF